MTSNEKHWVRQLIEHRRLVDVVLVVVIVACAAKLTYRLEQTMDVVSADETIYLHNGEVLPEIGLVGPAWGPLYQIWYYGLAQIVDDPIMRYFANFRILMTAMPLLIYVVLRQLKVPPLLGAFSAVYVLNSYLPYVWPYPAHLATMVLLATLSIALLVRPTPWKLAVLILGLQLAANCRPEMFLAFLLLSAVGGLNLIWLAIRTGRRVFDAVPAASLTSAVSLSLLIWIGNPLASDNGPDRQFIAFGQHYAVNRVESTREDLPPYTNWEKIVAREFGDAGSVTECLRANPSAFAWHLKTNALKVFKTWGQLSLPSRTSGAGRWVRLAVFVIGMGVVVGLAVRRRRQGVAATPSQVWVPATLAACIAPAVIPAVILVQPRLHYLLPSWTLCLLLVIAALARRPLLASINGKAWLRWSTLAAVAATGLLITPQRHDAKYSAVVWRKNQELVKTIHYLRGMQLADEVRLLRMEIGVEWYVADNVQGVDPLLKKKPFLEYLSAEQINMVLDEQHLRHDSRFRDDQHFKAFLEDPERFGFIATSVPGAPRDRRILTKSEPSQREAPLVTKLERPLESSAKRTTPFLSREGPK